MFQKLNLQNNDNTKLLLVWSFPVMENSMSNKEAGSKLGNDQAAQKIPKPGSKKTSFEWKKSLLGYPV